MAICRSLTTSPKSAMIQRICHITLVVREYDEAIAYFTQKLGFQLIEDVPMKNGKRWVLVGTSKSDGTTLLLAEAKTPGQTSRIGNQTGVIRPCSLIATADPITVREKAHYNHNSGLSGTAIRLRPKPLVVENFSSRGCAQRSPVGWCPKPFWVCSCRAKA